MHADVARAAAAARARRSAASSRATKPSAPRAPSTPALASRACGRRGGVPRARRAAARSSRPPRGRRRARRRAGGAARRRGRGRRRRAAAAPSPPRTGSAPGPIEVGDVGGRRDQVLAEHRQCLRRRPRPTAASPDASTHLDRCRRGPSFRSPPTTRRRGPRQLGSSTTQRGASLGWTYARLSPVAGSVIPAAQVNSAPDNVVGTAMCGAALAPDPSAGRGSAERASSLGTARARHPW